MADIPKPNMAQLMEMAQKMQAGMQDIQQKLINQEIPFTAGNVTVVFNGQYDCTKVNIPQAIKDGDREVLQDLVMAAINGATSRVKELSKDAMMNIYKEVGAPFEQQMATGQLASDIDGEVDSGDKH